MNPDEWAKSRIYPPSSGWPGPRNAQVTPYMIEWARVSGSGMFPVAAMVCGAQMGKTDTQLDIMGERLDNRPSPILYVGPSKEFNTDQFEPRLVEMLEQNKQLGAKASKKRQKKTLKRIAGVRVRLAHAGSSTALKSDPAALALVDEIDEMLANIKKQGDPWGLIGARGFTHADFVRVVASTPTLGLVESEVDMASGLEFWKEAPLEDLESAIWRIFQEGTMHHWAWPCPHCNQHFVPRMKLLKWPEDASPAQAKREAWLECPNCHAHIIDEPEGEEKGRTKTWMNDRGLMVARGQWIEDGVVVGEPKDTETISFWVSGLCSPFVTFGERAHELVAAAGDPDKMQTAVNAGCGELYAPGGGDVPEWKEVLKLALPYPKETLPIGAVLLTAGVDVQKNRLVYVIRAWGARATSWLIDYGELHGATTQQAVWDDLDELLSRRYGGKPIKVAFIDSGFRPGKPDVLPVNMVYEFCRMHSRFVFPTKGHDTQTTPIRRSKIEIEPTGGAKKYGLELMHLDSDVWKQWVHEKLRWPTGADGGFFLHQDTKEDYARQIVSEVRIKPPSGKASWVRTSRDNHYLDCEALCAAAGYFLNVQSIRKKKPEEAPEPAEETTEVQPGEGLAPTPPPAPAVLPAVAAQVTAEAKDAKTSKYAAMAARMNMPRSR